MRQLHTVWYLGKVLPIYKKLHKSPALIRMSGGWFSVPKRLDLVPLSLYKESFEQFLKET